MLFRCIAQGVAHNARFHASELLDRIYLQNPIQVFRYVDHNGNVHTLTAHRGAAAAWQYGRVEFAANTDRLDEFVDIAWNNDANGYLAVVRCVGAIHRAAARIEAHFSV